MIPLTPALVSALYRAGAALLIVLAALATGWIKGAAHVHASWDADKLVQSQAQQRAVLAAVAANEKARQADNEATRLTLNFYKENLHAANEKIAAERADADLGRLRIAIPARVCPAASAVEAPGPGRADAVATVETIELPASVERGLRDLAEEADREVAELRAQVLGLQEWNRTHGFYEGGRRPAH